MRSEKYPIFRLVVFNLYYRNLMELLKRLRELTPVWNINTLAEYFVSQLPATDAQYQKARLRVIKDVRYLYNELKNLEGFFAYPTGSNFVLIKILHGMLPPWLWNRSTYESIRPAVVGPIEPQAIPAGVLAGPA